MDNIQHSSVDNRNSNFTNSSTEANAKSLCLSFFVTFAIMLVLAFGRNASATDSVQTSITEDGDFGPYLFTLLFEPLTQKGQVSLVGFGTFEVRQRAGRSGGKGIFNETIPIEGNMSSRSIEYEVAEDSSCQTGYAVFVDNKSTAPDGCVPVDSRTELVILITPKLVDSLESPGMVPLPPPLSLFSVSSYLIDKVTGKVVDTDYPVAGFKAGKGLKDIVY